MKEVIEEALQLREANALLCMTCGVTMRPAGSYFVCEQCGSNSGCELEEIRK